MASKLVSIGIALIVLVVMLKGDDGKDRDW